MPPEGFTYDGALFHRGNVHGTLFVKEKEGRLSVWLSPIRHNERNYVLSLKIMKKEEYLEHTPSEVEYRDFINGVWRGNLPVLPGFDDFVKDEKHRRILKGDIRKDDEVAMNIVVPDAAFDSAATGMGFKLHKQEDPIVGDTKKILSLECVYA